MRCARCEVEAEPGTLDGPVRIVSRGRLDISNALPDPTLELRNAKGNVVGFNDDWQLSNHFGSGQELAAVGLAPTSNRESAMLVTLPNGNYMAIVAIVAGYNGATGVGLV